MIGLMVGSLVRQATKVQGMGMKAADSVKEGAIFITPNGSYKALAVTGHSEFADFSKDKTTDMEIEVRLTPATFVNGLLPFKDNLIVQFITNDFSNQVVAEYVAIPLLDSDVRAEGNNSTHANIEGISETTINHYRFQLMEPTYAKLRTVPISHTSLMSNMLNTISYVVDTESKRALEGTELKYDGLVMETPVSNMTNYSSVTIPEGVMLKDVPHTLQNDERYGVYDKALGFFFKQRRWWCYSLFDLEKVDKLTRTIDIIRMPKDKVPTLEYSFFLTEDKLTILSTGEAASSDQSDIERQNEGTGHRLINPSLISGETGLHYNAGRAVKTRADSMAEFAANDRQDGNNNVPLNPIPSSNVYKYLSKNISTNGIVMTIPWQHGDPGYLEPGAGIRYMFMGNSNRMEVRRGVLLGYRLDTEIKDAMTMISKRVVTLIVFMEKLGEES